MTMVGMVRILALATVTMAIRVTSPHLVLDMHLASAAVVAVAAAIPTFLLVVWFSAGECRCCCCYSDIPTTGVGFY